MPKVNGLPFFGGMHRMRLDPLGFLTSARKDPVVLLGRLPWKRYYLVNDPRLIETIFLDHTGTFEMTRDSDVLRALFDKSIFMLKGEAWITRRRLLHPAFHTSRFSELMAEMSEPIRAALKSLRHAASTQQIIDIEAAALDLVQQVIVRIMFGQDFKESGNLLRKVFNTGMTYRQSRRWSLANLPLWVPTPRNVGFRESLSELNRIMRQIVAEHNDRPQHSTSLLTLLFEVRDPHTGKGLTEAQIVEEVKTIFNTGYVTTATAVAWTIYAISGHPQVEEKVREELGEVMIGAVPSFEEAKELKYLSRVVKESLRLYPPGWMTTRRVRNDTMLGDYLLRAGSTIIVSQYVSHRDPALWDHPDEFDPTRFEPPSQDRRPKFAYYPFGAGPRQCIGKEIALLEMMAIIPALLKHYRFTIIPDQEIGMWPLSALKPRFGIKARIEAI